METVGGQASARLGQVPEWDAVGLLSSQIHHVHQLLDEQVAAASVRAKAASALQREILSLYTHVLCVEDSTVNLPCEPFRPDSRARGLAASWCRGT